MLMSQVHLAKRYLRPHTPLQPSPASSGVRAAIDKAWTGPESSAASRRCTSRWRATRVMPRKLAETISTRKWVSPPGRAPAWPAWRCDWSVTVRRSGASPVFSLCSMVSATGIGERNLPHGSRTKSALILARQGGPVDASMACQRPAPTPYSGDAKAAHPNDRSARPAAGGGAVVRASRLPGRRRIPSADIARPAQRIYLVLPRACPRLQQELELLRRHGQRHHRAAYPPGHGVAAPELADGPVGRAGRRAG